jgi:flagellar motility protein MotE (MotC chaperone)
MMLKRQRHLRLGRSVLGVIAVLLVSSALVRLGTGAGQAVARATENTNVAEELRDVQESPGMSEIMPKTMTHDEISDMITAFQAREERLAAREIALEDRMVALRIADQKVTEKLAQLEAAEVRLRDTIALAETASESDLDTLTRVYESMKPKQAAALFEEMDPNFAAGFLGRMRPEAAAQIMAGLSPEAAHMFSVVLAGRNANVPKE